MSEIKFKRVHKNTETGEIKVSYWGFIDDYKRVFTSPSYVSGLWEVIGDFQYTGLKDKNGTEIWEGDVIKWYYEDYEEPCITIVTYKAPSFSVPIGCELEVIGNIHENPELLEAK